jgi:hypothetical protein
MSELTAAWYSAVPEEFRYESSLLQRSNGLKREDPALQDFNHIRYEYLLKPPSNHALQSQLHGQLSIAKTDSYDLASLSITRVYDIDSSIFLLKSLEAIKSSINIAYTPPHQRTLTHTVHFPIYMEKKHIELHKLKNTYLGSLHQKAGCEIHIFFPRMPTSKSRGINTLNKIEQTSWVDDILIPAVTKTIPQDIIARHPTTYEDGITRNNSRAANNRSRRAEDARYDIPMEYLGALWGAIIEGCKNYRTKSSRIEDSAFRNPLLLLSLHGTKMHLRKDSLAMLLEFSAIHLETFLDMMFVDKLNSYQDIGIEDIPAYEGTPMTLLRRSSCIKHWIRQFECPRNGKRIRGYWYNWALTRDAATGEFECRPSNSWFKAGLSHAKAYNINKELFSGFDNSTPFAHPAFEFIGVDAKTLEDVLQRCKWQGFDRRGVSLESITYMLRKTTRRLRTALNDKTKVNFGIRQEYRIRVSKLRDIGVIAANR